MTFCPKCECSLRKIVVESGVLWECPQCLGHFVGVGVLTKITPPGFVAPLLSKARPPSGNGFSCPSCRNIMEQVVNPKEGKTLDVCRGCFSIWFDANEFSAFSEGKVRKVRPATESSRAIATMEMDTLKFADDNDPEPDTGWKKGLAILGFPVESRTRSPAEKPLITWGLAALLLLFCFIELSSNTWGYVPSQPLRWGGITTFTSFMVHGGIWHCLGNIYFLLVFGDDVEEHLGRWRYVALLLLANLAGDLGVSILTPHSNIPHIGASGGIFGIIIYYCFAFPDAHLTYAWYFGYRPRYYQVPAFLALGFYFFLEVWGSLDQIRGWSQVSHLSHVVGGIVGFLFFHFLKRNRDSGEA